MEEALVKLLEIIKSSLKSEILLYRGNGNFALMQDVMDHFFASFGTTLTNGSLCDGAGEAGIIEGRGSNKNMPLDEIKKAEVVIVWGRNPHATSSHLLPLLKGKKLIVIDPIKTKIAKTADIFIQIKPHSDKYFAMLLVHFLYINNENENEYSIEFENYYTFIKTIGIEKILDSLAVPVENFEEILKFLKDKKVAIVCGVGIQKYKDGADVLRSIDALAIALDLFGKEGSGVAYLGNSKEKINSPFFTNAPRVSKVNTEFNKFKTVFIQGANPLSQMPNTSRVQRSIKDTQNVIYFGLYENETSAIADLIIPAKIFLEKEDIRTSYSHNSILRMNKQIDTDIGISEYDLSTYLCKYFAIELKSEKEYLEYFENFSDKNDDVLGRENIPYIDGFDTPSKKFQYLQETNSDTKKEKNDFYLITPKSPQGLNSQFKRDEFAYVHRSLGFSDGEIMSCKSDSGSLSIKVKNSDDVREDCILIYSGTKGVNNLTSSQQSKKGNSAVYQESMIQVVKI